MINSAICNIFREAEKHLPSSKFNKAAKPYWCPELKRAHAQARHFRSVWLQLGRPRGIGHKSYVDYKSAKRMFRRLQRQCIDKYENTIFDKLNQAAHTDYRLFWKLLRSQGGSSFEVCNFLKVDGQSYSDSEVIVGFFKHFFGVFGSSQPEDDMSPAYEKELRRYLSRPCSVHNQSLLNSFELEELERAMGPLPRNKSPGHDGLLNEHLLNGGDSIKQMLLLLFNSVLRSAQVPDGWQTSIIIPIYKGKGKDKTDPSSYRPISLIPVVAKLFEKVGCY